MTLAKDLAKRWTDKVLLTREATNRSRDGFRLFYFYKSRYGLRYFSALPYSLDREPPYARGASASKKIKKTRKGGDISRNLYMFYENVLSFNCLQILDTLS